MRLNRRGSPIVFTVTIILLIALSLAAAILAEGAVHPQLRRRPSDTAALAWSIAQSMNATARKVSVRSTGNITLSAWLLEPQHPNGRFVIVCHDVADSAYGALGYALLFLRNGYSVLAPDSRGHGESGGIVTYGVLETGDINQWLRWLKSHGARDVFGFGESLGGAILIQSLAEQADFRAVVAECPYLSFESIAEERVARVVGTPIALLLVEEGILYVRARYGVNLWSARTDNAIAKTQVPILLIHGLADHETSPENSTKLAQLDPRFAKLRLVPGAKHTGAYSADSKTFERKVLSWFAETK